MENNNRGSWGSNIGFLLAAIGSAVGLGNIWGFPYKMGKCGGFTFLLVYLLLAAFVGFIIMCSELALGRKTKAAPIEAYAKVTKKYKFLGWFAVLSPFLIMTFYSVLGGYCIYYIIINFVGLFGGFVIGLSALFQGRVAAAAADALGETGKGTANYFIVVGIIETVALFTLVFCLLLLQ